MKKTVAVVLCGMLLLSMLAGCVEKDPLVGTWEGELDFSPMVNATMVSTGTNMEKYFTFTDLTVKVTMTFQEDKRCTLSIDRDGFDTMLEKLKSQVSTGIVGVLEDLLEGNGAEMTVQEYLDLSGMDLDMLIDSTLNVVITEQTLKELELEGLYQTEEGKLFISDDPDSEFDADRASAYVLAGDTLTIQAPQETEDWEILQHIFPLVLQRMAEEE